MAHLHAYTKTSMVARFCDHIAQMIVADENISPMPACHCMVAK